LALSILQIMNYAVPLVTVPYLTRVLGPERFGLLAFAQAIILYFDLITDYGFNLSATRKIASIGGSRIELSRIFWSTIITKTLLMLLCAAVLNLFLEAVPVLRPYTLLCDATFLTVVGSALLPVWLFQGLERMQFLTIAYSVARLLSIPALLFLVQGSEDYIRAAAIQGSVPVAGALILGPVIWKKLDLPFYRPSASDILDSLREGWHLFVSNTAMVLFGSTSVVLLGLMAGNGQVGYYSAADKLIKAGSSLMSPITQALYPHLNSLRASSEYSALRLIRKTLVLIGVLTFSASLATFALAGPIAHLLLGSRFGPSVTVLRFLAPVLFLTTVNNVLGTQTMMVFGLDALVSRITLRSAVANAVLALLLAGRWGAVGAAAATATSGVLMMLQMMTALRRAKLPVWQAETTVCAS